MGGETIVKLLMVSFLATAAFAGAAIADVKISGYGRTGLVYYEDDGRLPEGANTTEISSRLRMDIKASTKTDNDLEFGAQFRMQWDQGDAGVESISPGMVSVGYGGLIVYVGNVVPAFDGAPLLKQTRLGVFERSWGGDPIGRFFLSADKGYGRDEDRVGVALRYTRDNFLIRASYVDPDQSGMNESAVGYSEELSFAVNYKWEDYLEVTAATAQNGAGFKDSDLYFVGARYTISDVARVGMNFIDNGKQLHSRQGTVGSPGNTVVIYGDYDIGDVTLSGYLANNNGDWERKKTDNSFGIGANYDLGGAVLGASLQRDYDERLYADMGVRFDF
ncbi:outer membrane protein OmpU [Paracoccus pantotrophus]|nr:outer membrane protein OmpU [Paracoccus pantotrophus]